MKTGRNLQELAAEIMRQNEVKRDFIGDTREMRLEGGRTLRLGTAGDFAVNDLAHQQIATKVGIPKDYYDRMRTADPALLDYNVNRWFDRTPEKRLVRTLDGRARSFLSDTYRPLDNFDLSSVVLPRILDLKLDVKSSEITERRLYIQAVTPRLTGEVKKGDVVQAGIVIRNSEVGCGSLAIEPLVFRLICLNGAVMSEFGERKHHVGKRGVGDGDGDGVNEYFRNDTRRADDRAFWLKVRDMVDHVLSPSGFAKILDALRAKAGMKVEGKVEKVVEVTAKKYQLVDREREAMLKAFVEGGDLSAWGLANAATSLAHTAEDYDRGYELERIGGKILELSVNEWTTLAKTA